MTPDALSYFVCLTFLWLLARTVRAPRARLLLFLVASYLFYASWGLGFLAILAASSLMNYALGKFVRADPSALRLWLGVIANLALLILFKYLPPAAAIAGAGSLWNGAFVRIAMPVGISFWTFEALSYLFDVYRGEEAEPSLVEFCLYMSFWPTVLSGPVCRLPEMLPQFRAAQSPSGEDVRTGVHRIVLGLFMKCVLAQLLNSGIQNGEGVAYGFDRVASGWGGADVWFLAIGYGFQLFFDFAGYSHIVIGSARLFGITLAENFKRPYLSTTPSIFWTRWHMSLSFWIRDYVFLPLATARRNLAWRYFALAASMVIFGLWHGATLPLVAWGIYHGVLLVIHRLVQNFRKRRSWSVPFAIDALLSWAVTFVAVSLGWIIFRSHDLRQVGKMFGALLVPRSYLHPIMRPDFFIITAVIVAAYFAVAVVESLEVGNLLLTPRVRRAIWLISPVCYAAAIFLIIIWSKQETLFVYFQF
ncbi:MAG: MBOAT family O-acyltransferase [Candidatus Acidiferrales bacterium]